MIYSFGQIIATTSNISKYSIFLRTREFGLPNQAILKLEKETCHLPLPPLPTAPSTGSGTVYSCQVQAT
jgi:hypothetical protein